MALFPCSSGGSQSRYDGYFNILKSTSQNITVSNSYKGIMCCFGSPASLNGMYLVNTTPTGTGGPSVTPIGTAPSDINITTAVGSMTIQNSNSSYALVVYFVSFNGSVS